MRQYTDITVLVDRSGSMESIKESMESAYRTFIREHQKVPSSRISLILFDSLNDQDVQYEDRSVGTAPDLALIPRGNTPLLDALCQAIDRTGRRLGHLPAAKRPDQVLFVVITDGQENWSRKYTRQDVNKRIKEQSDRYNWQFVYLGANQDAFAEAGSLGFNLGTTMSYSGTKAGTANMWTAVAKNTLNYASNDIHVRGQSMASFDEEDRKKAEEV